MCLVRVADMFRASDDVQLASFVTICCRRDVRLLFAQHYRPSHRFENICFILSDDRPKISPIYMQYRRAHS